MLGKGIAGVTAADYVRCNHPDCAIDIVGREAHPLYNCMGISRIVSRRRRHPPVAQEAGALARFGQAALATSR